jgi:hypothetical protein
MATGINYGKLSGFDSPAAAIVFAVLYVPLFGWFARMSFLRPTYVFFVLTLFCAIRITAFSIRAALAGLDSAGENLRLFIADEILSAVGYFGLLYSAYTLVLDIELLSDRPQSTNPILVITRNRRLFRLAMSIAVALGISSATIDNGQSSTAKSLHKISVIIFLVLTILQAFRTAILATIDRTDGNQYKPGNQTFGSKHGIIVLVFIALLLLIREVFSAATLGNPKKFNNEHLWYPLVAVPELLAVILYTIPDLVPRRDEIPAPNNYALGDRAPQP